MNGQPEYWTGDIFAESWKVEALVNPVNCVGVMGRGLAGCLTRGVQSSNSPDSGD